MVRRRLLLLAIAAAACGGGAAPHAVAAGRLVDVQIVDRARHAVLPEHHHRGTAYVAGRPGDRYAVRLSNRSGARVLVVLSIDGVNAVSGETAAVGQTGYVLDPWQSAEITGWRKSDAEAAAFYFTALPDSYAARTGRPQNVGVIGAAVFRERVHQARPLPYAPAPFASGRAERREAPAAAEAPAPGRSAVESAEATRDSAPAPLAKADKLGTGHGEREYSPIERTSFERATPHPAEIVQVRYDSHANLVAAGVIPQRRGWPEPFPGFVPDPP